MESTIRCPNCGRRLPAPDSRCYHCVPTLDHEQSHPALTIAGFLVAALPVALGAMLLFKPGYTNAALNYLLITIALLPALWLILNCVIKGPARSFVRGLGCGVLAAFVSLLVCGIVAFALIVLGVFSICGQLPGAGK